MHTKGVKERALKILPSIVKICLVTNNNLVDRVEKRHKDEIVSGKQIKFGKDTQSGDKTI